MKGHQNTPLNTSSAKQLSHPQLPPEIIHKQAKKGKKKKKEKKRKARHRAGAQCCNTILPPREIKREAKPSRGGSGVDLSICLLHLVPSTASRIYSFTSFHGLS